MPESKESVTYREAYEMAKRADDAYTAACVAVYGRADARWRKHTDERVLHAQRIKIAADEAMHAALKQLHTKVQS